MAAIADVPRVAILHGRIQPSFVPLEGDQWLGIAGAAAVATRRGPHHGLTLGGGGAGSGHADGSVTRRERSRGRL